jgi:DNA-binding HxlR family transcriptional regulator
MTASRLKVDVPRVALTLDEAAASIGVGRTTFESEVKPEIKLIRRGRVVLVPVDELAAWATRNAEPVLPDRARRAP